MCGIEPAVTGLAALRAMGARRVGYLVPNRFRFGYGLTPEIVALAARTAPSLIVTVDNGIASLDGAPVAGYGGHPIRPHCSLERATGSDVVLVPPIFNDIVQTLAAETTLVSWLRGLSQNCALLASTCTGA